MRFSHSNTFATAIITVVSACTNKPPEPAIATVTSEQRSAPEFENHEKQDQVTTAGKALEIEDIGAVQYLDSRQYIDVTLRLDLDNETIGPSNHIWKAAFVVRMNDAGTNYIALHVSSRSADYDLGIKQVVGGVSTELLGQQTFNGALQSLTLTALSNTLHVTHNELSLRIIANRQPQKPGLIGFAGPSELRERISISFPTPAIVDNEISIPVDAIAAAEIGSAEVIGGLTPDESAISAAIEELLPALESQEQPVVFAPTKATPAPGAAPIANVAPVAAKTLAPAVPPPTAASQPQSATQATVPTPAARPPIKQYRIEIRDVIAFNNVSVCIEGELLELNAANEFYMNGAGTINVRVPSALSCIVIGNNEFKHRVQGSLFNVPYAIDVPAFTPFKILGTLEPSSCPYSTDINFGGTGLLAKPSAIVSVNTESCS